MIAGALALVGVWPRVWLAIATLLYLSFVSVGAPFLQFQWDSLLVECGVLAAAAARPAAEDRAPAAAVRGVQAVLRVRSGQMGLAARRLDRRQRDVLLLRDRAAAGALAWFAHNLPGWWHALESRVTLVAELVVPVLLFCGRRGRLVALVVLTGFQLLNLATANYGFFVWLALALHLFMLRDADLLKCTRGCRGARCGAGAAAARRRGGAEVAAAARGLVAGFGVVYVTLSLATARVELGAGAGRWTAALQRSAEPWHVFNAYHLFAQITRVRVEPEFAGFEAGRGGRTTCATSRVRSTGRRRSWRRTSRGSTSCCGSTGCGPGERRPATCAGC
ncbi:lipase maturation factor family protein [Nannocystis pusilla]|uniref:lipase maturation factor family protein n=1 Tax=Nannocystis pusilla TaxID=889268 RepID=UPI003B7972E1